MKRTLSFLVLVVALVASSAAASPVYNPVFAARPRHVLGDPVGITLTNEGTATMTMGETWDLEYLDGDGTAFYQWPEDELALEPGETRTWTWDQHVNQCYGECQNVRQGDPAQAGRYRVTTTVDGEQVITEFRLGRYFTLDFRGYKADEFVVFVATRNAIKQMREETRKKVARRKLITSSLVRLERPYNPNWKFSMDPDTIELGEVFIEVCDGSPSYVQKNRDEWLGERWCPWSSYVKRAGR